MKFATLLVMLAVAATGAGPERTAGHLNGRGWTTWSSDLKMGYILGIGDGNAPPIPGVDNTKEEKRLLGLFGHSTNGEIIAGLDDFYRDPANAQIPVWDAMAYFQDKVRGKSPADLAGELSGLRAFAANVQ